MWISIEPIITTLDNHINDIIITIKINKNKNKRIKNIIIIDNIITINNVISIINININNIGSNTNNVNNNIKLIILIIK